MTLSRSGAEPPKDAAPCTDPPPTAADPLDEAMARLRDGDRSGFDQVFHEVWPKIVRLCTALLGHEADALDAAQEAMHKILIRAGEYDPARPARPWAMAIAAWEARTLARRRERRREVAVVGEMAWGRDDREDALVQADLVQAAVVALGELSELDRETLVATFWDEGASVSGATLRKRRERALVRLRRVFGRLYGSAS